MANLPPHIAAALDLWIDYAIADEKRHFFDQARPDPDHIYNSIYAIAKWLGVDLDGYRDPTDPVAMAEIFDEV